MYLKEKLDELNILKQKIRELHHSLLIISDEQKKDVLAEALFKSIDELQNIRFIIDKVNTQTIINVGGTSINISTAIIIRNNLKRKIDVISDIIRSNTVLDTLTLMSQRDAFFVEYNSINKSIMLADWSITID